MISFNSYLLHKYLDSISYYFFESHKINSFSFQQTRALMLTAVVTFVLETTEKKNVSNLNSPDLNLNTVTCWEKVFYIRGFIKGQALSK